VTDLEKNKPGLLRSLVNRLRFDGWTNELTGLGDYERDKRLAAIPMGATRLPFPVLDALYHGDWLMRRCIDLRPEDMTRKWLSVQVADDANAGPAITQRLEELSARTRFREALTWAEAKGGALILMGADDRSRDLAEPLDESAVRSVDWLEVLDCSEVIVHSFADGLGGVVPETYRIIAHTTEKAGLNDIIHASRFIRLNGPLTSREERRRRDSWAMSRTEIIHDAVRDVVMSYGGAAHLVTDFSQAVIKIKGLSDALRADEEGVVLARVRLLDMARSIARILPLDSDGEDFERKATPVSGLPELLDRLGMALSAATSAPQTKLFGRSPAGLSATGESDVRLWYDLIGTEQEDRLRPAVERLIRLILLSREGPTRGREPQSWKAVFSSLWQESEKTQAETRYIQAQADRLYVDMGLPSHVILRNRFTADGWSGQTVLEMGERELEALTAKPAEEPETKEAEETTATTPTLEAVPEGAAVQETALNGAQIVALKDILESVSSGTLTRATALPLILSAFPAVPETRVTAMLDGVEVKEPAPPAPTPPLPAAQEGPPEGKPEAALAVTALRGDEREPGQRKPPPSDITVALSSPEDDSALEALRPERLQTRLTATLDRTLRSAAEEAMADLGMDPRILTFDLLNPRIKLYLEEYAGTRGLLAEMTATQRDILRTKLRESSLEGEGQAARARRIRDLFRGESDARIQMIARTEAHNAVSYATHEAHKLSGVVTMVKWVHNGPTEGGEREGHAMMDGQTVRLGDLFENPLTGARAEAPGMFGDPAEDINCRCVTVASIDLSDPDEIPQPRADAKQLSDAEQVKRREARIDKHAQTIEEELRKVWSEWLEDVLRALGGDA
jgi:phage-related protein (TIGR01555 family)